MATAAVRETSATLYRTIQKNLDEIGRYERMGTSVTKSMTSLEEKLIKEYSKPQPNEQEIAKLEIQYKRAARVYTAFQEIMRNIHELLMQGIRNLRLS